MGRKVVIVVACVAGFMWAGLAGALAQPCSPPCQSTPVVGPDSGVPVVGGDTQPLGSNTVVVSPPSGVVAADGESVFRYSSSSGASWLAAVAGGSIVLITLTVLVRRREAWLQLQRPYLDEPASHSERVQEHAWDEVTRYNGVALDPGRW